MAAQELVATQKDGDVLIIRLANPESRNSMTMDMREQLGAAIALAERQPGIRAVFLTGDGPTFCSGGDLNHLRTACDPWTVHRRFRNLSRWLTPLISLDKPVVVGVNGHAVGGGMGLALTGDVVIAGESAKFMSGFFRLGVVPDIAVMYHLPRLIGMARAKNFLFSGGTFSAQEAADLGLVSKVVADATCMTPASPRPDAWPKGPPRSWGWPRPSWRAVSRPRCTTCWHSRASVRCWPCPTLSSAKLERRPGTPPPRFRGRRGGREQGRQSMSRDLPQPIANADSQPTGTEPANANC